MLGGLRIAKPREGWKFRTATGLSVRTAVGGFFAWGLGRIAPKSRPGPGAGAACPRIVDRSAKRNGPVCTTEGAVVNLDCRQVRELMDSYLSEELSVETNLGFLHHMARCRDCAAELTRRQRLRALLSET